MNNKRRKALDNIASELNYLYDEILGDIESKNKLTNISAQLEAIKDEEEIYMDNMPEGLQNSERYDIAECACDNMSEAIENLTDAIETNILEDVLDYIDNAIECIEDAII